MNATNMWQLTNVHNGQVVYCATRPPMDNPFDGWNSQLWRLEPPMETPDPCLCATPDPMCMDCGGTGRLA